MTFLFIKTLTYTNILYNISCLVAITGLPHLPESFWNNSYFQEEQNNRDGKHSGGGSKANSRNCHGSAANMFGGEKRDYRMLMCAQVNDEDLITIHHELGHIMYFMAYSQLPTIFQVLYCVP